MYIHWYPGHMTKAIRMMQKELTNVDSIVYVLDARAPLSSINSNFNEIIANKPILYVLNKADLVSQDDVINWKNYFDKQGKTCIVTNSTQKGSSKKIIDLLIELNKEKLERYKNRGINKTIRAMVIGIPNCGKSTLINSLIAKKKTITGNKPGVTKGKQWVSIDKYIDLLDTPGTLYPDFSDQKKAGNLAIIGSINESVIDIIDLAYEIIEFLTDNYPTNLKERYNIEEISEIFEKNIFEIGKRRGFFVKGGEIDIEKTAKAIVMDFRRQAFGKIILEKVQL